MDTKFTIRMETFEDTEEVSDIIKQAFEDGPRGHHGEATLVEKIRATDGFIPYLSLIALDEQKIVGHIILSRVFIKTASTKVPTLILAPVSVRPAYQNRGLGGQLIKAAHAAAIRLGEAHVFLLGYAAYYPKFGYQPSRNFGIVFPDGMDNDNCMAIELVPGSLETVEGVLEYSRPFYEI